MPRRRRRRRYVRHSRGRRCRCPTPFGWAGIRCGSGRCRGSANSVIAATSAPGTLSSRSTTDVRSAPVLGGGGPGGPTNTKRVLALGSSTTSEASAARPYRSAASAVLTPASARPSATSTAAAALELAGTRSRRRQVCGQPTAALARAPPGRRRRFARPPLSAGRTTMVNATSRVSSAKIWSSGAGREAVQRRQHRPLDRVLDRHARVVGIAGADGFQRRRRAARSGVDPSAVTGHQSGGDIPISAASVKVPSGPR